MKDAAFFIALLAFALAGLGVSGWGWFLFVALLFGVFG